jgi:predicted SnoaL-like aldol condensation-catalyzing enzyme
MQSADIAVVTHNKVQMQREEANGVTTSKIARETPSKYVEHWNILLSREGVSKWKRTILRQREETTTKCKKLICVQ